MSIEESYNWIFNDLNTSDTYNFFFLWQGTYIDKKNYFSIGSTSLNSAVKGSWNAICLLESAVFQAGSAVKKIIKKHKIKHNMVKRCGRDGWSSDAT